MNYRPEIDGLRALAITSVILYHADPIIYGKNLFEGGFVGVDIFFVISGYLITRLILNELNSTGSFRFADFYESRARRILPALLLMIAICIPFAWQKLLPTALLEFSQSAISAIGFVSNFFFHFQSIEYDAGSSQLKPLLHTWSLGVEEQFYLIVPMVLYFVWRFSNCSLLTFVLAGSILSLQLADFLSKVNSFDIWRLNFFLPFSRFWELAVGSLIAVIEVEYGRLRHSLVTKTLPIVGVFLVIHSILTFDSNTAHPSFHTLIPIIGVALIIAFCSRDDLVGQILGSKIPVSIGLISYSLYLWHFPIFAFSRVGISDPTNYQKLIWIVLSLLISIFSYRLVERPFRERHFLPRKFFVLVIGCLTLSLMAISLNLIAEKGYPERVPAVLVNEHSGLQFRLYKSGGSECFGRRENFCTEKIAAAATNVYAFGDSHFSSLSPQLVNSVSDQFNYTEVNLGGCPFALNAFGIFHTGKRTPCNSDIQAARFNLISEDQSIVILGGRFPLYLSGVKFDNQEGGVEGGKWGSFETTTGLSFEEEFSSTVQRLIEQGHRVVLVYPIPEVGVDVKQYIFDAVFGKNISDIEDLIVPLTTSYDVYLERSKKTFELFDKIQSPSIYRVYPHTLFCNRKISGRCITHDNENIFYADDDHPSAHGSQMIVDLIMEQIYSAEFDLRGQK
jgi:peptidoglycan/LPS O-acetylase OafA/YrhL